jgi:hypothetical protein
MLNRDALNKGSEKNTFLIRVGITVIVGLLSLATGLWLGSAVLDSSDHKVSDRQTDVETFQPEPEVPSSASQSLTEELAAATHLNGSLVAQLSAAEEQVSGLEKQVESIQSQIVGGQVNLETLKEMSYDVEKHRILLVELRKNPPQTREEAITYWNLMKTIATRADTALASPAGKVILKIDNYFDWSARTPSVTTSTDDYINWLADYVTSGAAAYEEATATFIREALLAVITEMDTVVSLLH